MKKQLLFSLIIFGISFLFFKTVNAQTYVTNGLATLVDPVLHQYRLTLNQGGTIGYGTVWYQNKLDLRNDFTVSGQVYLGTNDGWGADGIAFVLQSLSVNAGGAGGGIGYYGVKPSFAVEYDTYSNFESNDPYEDHSAIQINGEVAHNATNTVIGPKIFSTNIENGLWHDVKYTWTAATKNFQVFWEGSSTPFFSINYDISANVFSGSPFVYFGFTAAVGAAVNEQSVRISNATFVSEGVSGVVTNASCAAAANGAISITPTGFTEPLTYLWSNGAITQNISGLVPNIYTVTVTDAAVPAKSIVSSFTVGANQVVVTPTINIAITGGTMPVCQGKNLSFNATTTNGGSNPLYEWTVNYAGNSVVIGNAATLTYSAFFNGGVTNSIRCKLTSDAACAAPAVVLSNSIDIATTYGPIWYLDADGDHYYTGSPVAACSSPGAGYTTTLIPGGDCNDGNRAINPGAIEICGNGIDDNCNGRIDEGCTLHTFYKDADKDNYGNAAISITNYTGIPPAGYVSNKTDCNDNNKNINPGAIEICGNGIDDNCNGRIDEGCAAQICVSICDAAIKEGDCGTRLLWFAVWLSRPAITTSSVRYKTTNGTAQDNSDYKQADAVLSFSPGQRVKYISVVINGDRLVERDETFIVTLCMPVNLKLATKSVAKGTIINDDKACGSQALPTTITAPFDKTNFKLIVPNLVRRSQQWQIPNLPVNNKVMLYDANGTPVLNVTNYRNDKNFSFTAAGMYYYNIVITNKEGKLEILKGKIVVMD